MENVFRGNIRLSGSAKLVALYAVTLTLLYCCFWVGYYFLDRYWGIWVAVLLVVGSSIALLIKREQLWTALVSCITVSMGLGFCISTYFVVLGVVPSRFFGLVLLFVLAYKSLQCFFMTSFNKKTTITGVYIITELILMLVFFSKTENVGLYSQVAFALLVSVFLSFGQLALYKCGANNMWRTIALSYIIGFALIVLIVIILILSALSEDGSGFEFLGELTFGAVSSGIEEAGIEVLPRRKRRWFRRY